MTSRSVRDLAVRLFGPSVAGPLLASARFAKPHVRAAALALAASLEGAERQVVLEALREALREPSLDVLLACARGHRSGRQTPTIFARVAAYVGHEDERDLRHRDERAVRARGAARRRGARVSSPRDRGRSARPRVRAARGHRLDAPLLDEDVARAPARPCPRRSARAPRGRRRAALRPEARPRPTRSSSRSRTRSTTSSSPRFAPWGSWARRAAVRTSWPTRATRSWPRPRFVRSATPIRARARRRAPAGDPRRRRRGLRRRRGHRPLASLSRSRARRPPAGEDALFAALDHPDAEVVKLALSLVGAAAGSARRWRARPLPRSRLLGGAPPRRRAPRARTRARRRQGLLRARYEREKDPIGARSDRGGGQPPAARRRSRHDAWSGVGIGAGQ